MRSKKKIPAPSKVMVSVHRNGAEMQAEVDGKDALLTLQGFLEAFREATKQYPELIVDLPHVGGSSIEYVDDWSGSDYKKRKIGF
jgi:hypothetical protein